MVVPTMVGVVRFVVRGGFGVAVLAAAVGGFGVGVLAGTEVDVAPGADAYGTLGVDVGSGETDVPARLHGDITTAGEGAAAHGVVSGGGG